MPKPIIVANWKMNVSPTDSVKIASSAVRFCARKKPRARVIIAPSFESLVPVRSITRGSLIECAAQNCADHLRGAYTGEVSPASIKNLGCTGVIIGHSERRRLYSESDDVVAAKVHAAVDAGLTPIVCIGETAAERRSGSAMRVLKRQVRSAVSGVTTPRKKFIIAYEPLWAIGSGQALLDRDAFLAVRNALAQEIARFTAARIPLLYGGSVTPENSSFFISACDGVLVGSLSQTARSFLSLLEAL